MEELTIQIEKTAGLAREDTECGVINKKINLADSEIGHLVCCLLVYDSDQAKRQDSVRDIFEIAERNLDGAEGSILEVLKETLERLRTYLEEQVVHASFLIAFFYRNVCYIAKHGERVRLLIYEGSKKSGIDIEAGSGPVSAGQTYLVATDKFLELFNESTYLKEELELSEIIDGLATEISANVNQAEIGVVMVRAEEPVLGVNPRDKSRGFFAQKDEIQEKSLVEVNSGADSKNREKEEVSPADMEEEQTSDYHEEEMTEDSKDIVEAEVKTEAPDPAVLLIKRVFKEIGRIRKGDFKAILRLRRNILVLVFLTVMGLGVFGGYTYFQKNEKTKQQEISGYLISARSKLNEGASIIEFNKQRAREILISAQQEAEKAKKINSRDEGVVKLIGEIENKLAETEQTTSINFTTFAEVGSVLQSISYNGSKIEAFGQDKIFELDSSGRVVQEYEGINGIKSGAIYDNKAFVLADSGAISLDFSSGKISTITSSVAALDIGVFFGNVYLLLNSQIAKYVPIEGGYSQPLDYLEKPENFGGNSKMAIDSAVWVSSGSKILKFNRGVSESFEISGLPGGVGDLSLIFTDSNLDNVYVVDKTVAVLLVIDKGGVYNRALTSPEFGRARDILINDAENKIYVAVDNKILSTELK